jgi:CheY-like chemotaxis protein
VTAVTAETRPRREPADITPESLVRVVIADDDEPTRQLLRALLEFVPTLEVVGVASDGREAVDLVLSEQADIALLDVEMPVMGGFLAAELIGSHRPSTRVILHTAYAEPIKQARADALGLPLLVKNGFEKTVAAVAATFDAAHREPGPLAIQAIVLAALAAHGDRPMLVVRSDRQIPFYTAAAAALLELPVPAEPMSLDALRGGTPFADRLGQPIAPEDSPLERALMGETIETGELSEVREDGAVRTYDVNVVPLRDPEGRFLGVACFLAVLAETRVADAGPDTVEG